jgi:glycosyltransferase involved in cell wall biosynthesis
VRVLYWCDLFWPHLGGAEVLSADLIEALGQRGGEALVVTRQDPASLPGEARFRGVSVRRLPFFTAFADGNVDRLIAARHEVGRIKQSFAPDLIHVMSFGASVLFHLDTVAEYPAPSVVTLHGERALETGDTLLLRTLRAADWVTGVSAFVLDQARALVPEIRPRSSVIYNGRPSPLLPPEPLPADPPTLLCLGRLVARKGFDLALSAFASLADGIPCLRLIVAGDGPARAALERQAARLGVADRVEFLGAVGPAEIPAVINRATVVAVPSRREGLPLVALEAALMARPVVATRVGGLPEVVVDRKTGLLVDPDDEQALAEALASIVTDPERAARLGERARRRAIERFGWAQCVAAYASLYHAVRPGADARAVGPRVAVAGAVGDA